jgi:hypothetical protein
VTEAANEGPINSNRPWSERDLLVLYAGLSMGTGIPEIAVSLKRTEEEVLEKAATLKVELFNPDA